MQILLSFDRYSRQFSAREIRGAVWWGLMTFFEGKIVNREELIFSFSGLFVANFLYLCISTS